MPDGAAAASMRAMNKLITGLLATVALFGAGTATASAQMSEWGEDEAVNVVATSGSMKIVDEETFGANEVKTFNLAGTKFGTIGGWSPWPRAFNTTISRCAGGEVRGELHVKADAQTSPRTVWLEAYVYLYEGTSCSTTDFDGYSEHLHFHLDPGQSITKTFKTTNMAEGAGDSVTATVTFSAQPIL